ncbi:GH92 family glycosyl hydrolase [Microbacterium sp. JB110]|uniref:GH92 family glycosyl hydrolase n=1 Tax=Microbacterium sp. JB110 TaxID=2024477 RepID=UPI00097F4A10|nr:GH92 family glycosyl hydrolase [Microbacterium sp. JB110]SJM52652.1 Alpha-1,2-mannosidase [Frigoribacterium sp. JB110]
MIPFNRVESQSRRRARIPQAMLAAAAVVAAVLLPTTAATAAEPEFASSFETGDETPALRGTGESAGVSGGQFAPGSVLPHVIDVTASDENAPNETADNLADGNPSSKWLVFSDAGWAQFELSEPQPLGAYTLTSGNDAPDRDPRDFRVLGSNDGENWTQIDSRAGEEAFSERGETRTYTPTAPSDSYTFYRLDVSAVQSGGILQLAGFEPLADPDAAAQPSDLALEIDSGPTSSSTAKTGVGFTGTQALRYSGRQLEAGPAHSTSVVYDDLAVAVADDAELSYAVFPVLDGDQSYAATFVAVDLLFDDGSTLSGSGATDDYGFGMDAAEQGAANKLWPDQWNRVSVDLAEFSGRTVNEIRFTYDHPGEGVSGIELPTADTTIQGWLDDLRIAPAAERDTSDGLVSYVDTRRGTNSSGGFSRGNNIPAAAMPNGFNFLTPMTDADNHGTIYQYQRANTPENRPALEGIGFSHQPSIWMGDRNQLAVLPAAGSSPTSTLEDRRLAFGHENETARPDLYAVEFDDGITTEVTPTDHGAIYRFGFAGDSGSVLVDEVVESSGLTVEGDTVSGWVDGGSGWPGRTRMFVYGTFDAEPVASGAAPEGDRTDSARYAAFDTSADDTVELRIASSFISQEQANHNHALELEGVAFDDAHALVRDAWNERLSVVHDVQGASDDQLVSLYSSLYRLNLYPNSQFENVGTAEEPQQAYASPVSPTTGEATDTETNAEIVDGKVYVNNGFWDTYRTAWPLYALLYPDVTDELVDGFVQQYRDGGWIARWSSPGYADLMTGTSSDVAFAEAYLAGALDTETALDAYDAALKNATVRPDSNAVGRKGLEQSIFLGYTQKSTHQSVSWGLEGFINDFGISEMAAALADDPNTPAERVDTLREEADYFTSRAEHYAEMYNPDAGVFAARNADGSWANGADFDKKEWGEDVTEASAWTFAFHAPHDVDGMAALYGGRNGLLDELHEFLTEREEAAYSGIHEAREARDVRLGMLGMSNQVAHHIPYVLAEAGDPTGAQELIRDIQNRMFVGSDIGQGYPGDEDNGEFSAWYVFSALGFYPLENGSGDYTIGTPLFDAATLSIGDRDIRISAPGASDGMTYVDGVSINGRDIGSTTFDGDLLRAGGDVEFAMSKEPSQWGAKDLDEEIDAPEPLVDATKPGRGSLTAADGTPTGALTDDNMNSSAVFDAGSADLTWRSSSGPVSVDQYTLTAEESASAPESWTLSGSVDGSTWVELDSRNGEEFRWGAQTRPFSVDDGGAYTQLRLEASSADGRLALAEIEFFASVSGDSELSVNPADDQSVAVGDSFDAAIATIVGPEEHASGYDVSVDYGDGDETGDVTLTHDDLGGWRVSAPHTFTAPGAYDATVTVRDSSGAIAAASARIDVHRDDTFVGAMNNVCIGDLGETAASCDGQGYGYFRDKLAADGFVQGETVPIPDTELTYDLPAIPAGEPDNVTGDGQSFGLDLGEDATQLAFVGTATELARSPEAVLGFTDGTEQTVNISFGDWVGASGDPAYDNVVVAVSEGRLAGTSAESTVKNTAIYATAPVTLDTDADGAPKVVESLTMPDEPGSLRDGRVHVFAIASDGARSAQDPLSIEAGAVGEQVAGEEFSATLAAVTGGLPEQSATVNWGDGSPVGAADVADGAVEASHTYDEAGTYDVVVTVDDGVRSARASLEIEVVAPEPEYSPEITVSPDEVAPGHDVRIDGTGFAPGEDVEIRMGTTDAVTTTADDEGSVSAVLSVPESTVVGDYPVIALGEVSQVEASTTLSVRAGQVEPERTSIDLSAGGAEPVAGETVGLTATVAPSEATGTVKITSDDSSMTATTGPGGATSFEVTMQTAGTHEYVAHFVPDDPDAYEESTSAPLRIEVSDTPMLDAELIASADSAVQGGSLRLTGRGFAAGETVSFALHSEPLRIAQAVADGSGGFSASVTIPAHAPVGDHRLVATGKTSGLDADVPLEVTAALPDDLPTTGGTIPVWLIMTLGALLIAGFGLVVISRMRRSR